VVIVFAERRSAVARVGAALLRVRWVVRAPIWVFRARLGAVFGRRLVMIEHIGRSSGLRRHVVLEVVDRPGPGSWVVVAGLGRRAQWFRNVEADPRVRVYRGSHAPVAALARRLGPGAVAVSLGRYADAHPRAWTTLRRVLEESLGTPVDERGTDLLVVAIELVPRPWPSARP
jgi:deazaflavin-dependent oxidoreductase (nitroreductase family)